MKKLFIVCLIAVFAVVGANAFAWGDCPGPQCGSNTADGLYQANAYDHDKDFSKSSWHGNDKAKGEAAGNAGGTLETYANGGDTQIPIYEEVAVSGLWKKFHEGQWEWINPPGWNNSYWEYQDGYWEYKTRDLNYSPSYHSGWEFDHYNYETQLVGYDTISNPAFEAGFVIGISDAKAWSWAKDFGKTSKAGAGAKFEGFALSSGVAIGEGGCDELVTSNLYVEGSVYQYNEAAETGYYAGGISGGNDSGAYFYAVDNDQDSGNGFASDINFVSGKAITKGETFVTIDDKGSHRSIFGTTNNFAKIETHDTLQQANVYGNGGVGGVIKNGNSFAGGNANFSYSGATFGKGSATLKATVVQSHGVTTATSFGSSSAFGN